MTSVAEAHAARNGIGPTPVAVIKRDGRRVPFDPGKIFLAVQRCCLNSTRRPEKEAQQLAGQIARAVVNVLCRHEVVPGVEHVQDVVLQQLYAAGLFVEATHYQNYREEHRKAREERPIAEPFRRAVAEDAAHFPTPLQHYQFLSKFARFRDDLGRRETWREACDRVLGWFRHVVRKYQVLVSDEEWALLDESLYTMEAVCALRILQMAGPALERCELGAYNCATLPIDCLEAFAELLYVLMQGSGCSFSVEAEFVDKLPRVKKQKTGAARVVHRHKIADTTEGWCDAWLFGLRTWFAGEDVEFDAAGIRPAGARLKTKGGRASGPGPLLELLNFTRKVVLSRQGGRLSDLDVHDLCCMGGKIVQVGGVRRASTLSHSDLDSVLLRDAKSGPWYQVAPWRTMANNSAVYHEQPDAVTFMEEWLALAKSGSGERGIFNLTAVYKHLPARRKKTRLFVNPCGEILIRACGLCNLTIAIARPGDTEADLTRKVRAATLFGKIQSLCTDFGYVRDAWRKNCVEERLLGVDITGHADCPLLRYGAPGRAELLGRLSRVVDAGDIELSKRWGINRSAASRCVKPSGDSAVLFGCAAGISARFAAYQLRWIRQSVNDPVTQLLKDAGVPWAVAPEDDALIVFPFPLAAPAGATVRNDLTAVQQLENWLEWKRHWAEHSVSATIYVDAHEWLAAGHWVYQHFDDIVSLAFLPKDNGHYTYAPNEEITQEEYARRAAEFPRVDWAKLVRYEKEDSTTGSQSCACGGGACERT